MLSGLCKVKRTTSSIRENRNDNTLNNIRTRLQLTMLYTALRISKKATPVTLGILSIKNNFIDINLLNTDYRIDVYS